MQAAKSSFIALVTFVLFLTSCGGDYYPKPRGYFRIDLPEKHYIAFDTAYPYYFEYPDYAKLETNLSEPYWVNLVFPMFKGTLHLSYKPVHNNLNKYLEDTRNLAMKHIAKATGIENREYVNRDQNVYGLTYNISGTAAASPFQFYVTDSTHNFVRGALYFKMVPNNDSLAPVIAFLEEDIQHLIDSFRWK
ncbi:MAG: gliding motility lipoprotein GldD [Bacteroidales bacterium]|nr:gliding motility lipoprotein GldD [Bacteroidales bacterium]